MKNIVSLIAGLVFCSPGYAEPEAFKIECTQEYFGETVRTVFERSTKYEDKYFGMGIGARAENPVAYRLVSAEIRDEAYGYPIDRHLVVNFDSNTLDDAHDKNENIIMYTLTFFLGTEDVLLVSATLSPDKDLLITSSNSQDDGSNFRDCVSVGLN